MSFAKTHPEGVAWCDCPKPTSVSSGSGPGDSICDKCLGWIEVSQITFDMAWRGVVKTTQRKRPRDRAPVLMQGNFSAFEIAIAEQIREFDGFCTPCGGLRKHKLGCPVKRKP